MYLLSSGKSTVVSEFGSLDTKDEYKHENNDQTDFQFFPRQLLFAELNKKDRVEIFRIKEKKEKELKIQRVKKLSHNDAVCIACPKCFQEEVALGMGNGKIKLFNHMRSQIVHEFPAENIKSCVQHLDYNASDEHLSAVFDNGKISIFSMRSKMKVDTIDIDGVSTMSRFHPIKRAILTIASHKGNVTIYDMNKRNKTFHYTDVHTSPCRDLCMTQTRPDILISVGFDCRVNIIDMRRNLPISILNQDHPLSAGAISGCGNYFCIGNLKGDLTTYDMRKIKETSVLKTKKVHQSHVARVAFFSTDGQKDFTTNTSNHLENITSDHFTNTKKRDSDPCISNTTNNNSAEILRRCDSFSEFLDFHQQSVAASEKHSISCLAKRKSYDCWDALGYKVNTSSTTQRMNKPNISDNSNNSAYNSPRISFEHELNNSKFDSSGGTALAHPATSSATRDRAKLIQIQEERFSSENTSSGSDKENNHTDLEMSKRLPQLTADRNSTPKLANSQRSNEMSTTPTLTGSGTGANIDVAQWRAEINERFDKLETELKFQMESNKWQIYTQNFNLWSKLNENNEAICDALGILLQTDPFVNEYQRLKRENEVLKKQLEKFTKKF